MNIWLISTNSEKKSLFCFPINCILWEILTICSYFLHLLHENQYIWIQICCSLLCIILNRCFVIKERNSDLVPLLTYHVKYLVISHIWQLWHMITFERGRSVISHFCQPCCYPMCSMTFINLSKVCELHIVNHW